MCKRRLQHIGCAKGTASNVVCGDAFSLATYDEVLESGYDLVITNPPYVRYQALNGRSERVRHGLADIVEQRLSNSAREIWRVLTNGYSGLADLSIPAWLLSALLVKPKGRLALVVPATWRSRDYADAIRYLLLRCFQLELIVEDTQPGWFSDALVRTHLIVARRLPEDEGAKTLSERSDWPAALWVQVSPEAASPQSLVGMAFRGDQPESDFAVWCRSAGRPNVSGISVRTFSLEEEWLALRARAAGRSWMKSLEQVAPASSLSAQPNSVAALVPEALRDIIPTTLTGIRCARWMKQAYVLGKACERGATGSSMYVSSSRMLKRVRTL
ncbi:hypothetical protein A8U91_02953 [Halomonas elongata]|uniref:site-specific DNA-methyltransferase (adenine-specific) n=1 Tax=Halomonas elongata TaxID=2746 RepID=A0A1B8NV73_HALEL|nr:hypothetical protein A8U91_02953 [Halomonas elongata]